MSDLIIEGAKGISDGLYVIKDGELFKYKPNGGTVRSYHVKDRPKGKWHKNVEYSATGNERRAMADQCSACSGMVPWGMSDKFDFCPNCGADMRGEDE